MDATRFDHFARTLGRRLSRRQVVSAAAALVTATTMSADTRATGLRICRQIGSGCTRGSQCCTGYCESRSTAPRTVRYRCQCPPDTRLCGDACISVANDPENCGACGNVCDPGAATACVDGDCVCGQWDACTDGVPCATDHCAVCSGATELMCYVLADGATVAGNFGVATPANPIPCQTLDDCTNVGWSCNVAWGQEMVCVAAFYVLGTLYESYPEGSCRCISL